MYNGIGLQSARGSGTSGHIQSNISLNLKKTQNREKFLQQLEEKRNAYTAPPRKANSQIIQHQRKRQILIQSLKLREKLEKEGLNSQEIQQKIARGQQILKRKYQRGELQTKVTQAKQREYQRLSKAFGLNHDIKQGSAFDFDHNKQERLKKVAQKFEKQGFVCEHEGCGKKYETKQHLARHLKYKHLKQEKQA